MDQEGKVIHRLFGKWHEGLYCGVPPSAKCVWRPGTHLWTLIFTMHMVVVGIWSSGYDFYSSLLRLHAHWLWALLRLHQVCYRTQRVMPWTKRRPTKNWCSIQTRPEVMCSLPVFQQWKHYTCRQFLHFMNTVYLGDVGTWRRATLKWQLQKNSE